MTVIQWLLTLLYHLYTTYVLPSGGLYATYHLLGEPFQQPLIYAVKGSNHNFFFTQLQSVPLIPVEILMGFTDFTCKLTVRWLENSHLILMVSFPGIPMGFFMGKLAVSFREGIF